MRGKRTAVIRIDADGNEVRYATETIAAKENYIARSAISKAISRGAKCCGFRWEFAEPDCNADSFGARLRFLRECAGLSIDRMSELVGICTISARKYETGKMIPSAEKLSAFADFFNVTMDELWRGA